MRSSLVKPLRTRLGVATVVIAALFAALAPALLRAADSQDGQKTDLKVLLVTDSATPNSSIDVWKANLDQEGVPYGVFDANGQTLNDAFLADYAGKHAYYQAVILTLGNLGDGSGSDTLTSDERTALTKFETTFGIREISDNPYPYAGTHGFTTSGAGATQDGKTGTLTTAGKAVFPELKGDIPIPDNDPDVGETWGNIATPDTSVFQTLVSAPAPNASSPYLGIYTHPDGVEEMVLTVSANQYQIHDQLLRRGMIRWVTRGVHLGSSRTYFSAHIDDIFLPNTLWDTTLKCTPGNDNPATCPASAEKDVRMEPADTAAVLAWQNAQDFKFDYVFNGWGYRREFTGNDAGDSTSNDPLGDDPTYGLLKPEIYNQFRWINHTWSHVQLDLPGLNTPPTTGDDAGNPEATLNYQIGNNITFAQQHGLPIDPHELVTGEHSGLGSYLGFTFPDGTVGKAMNPDMPAALNQNGITWVGDDASVQPNQRTIPGTSTKTVPRHPSNVYYNVDNRTSQLDEYNWVYLDKTIDPVNGNCDNTKTTCRTTPATWDQYTASEVGIMLNHLLDNDPRPHYMHQPDLITRSDVNGGQGIMIGTDKKGVLDILFAQYDQYFNRSVAPITDPSMTEAGTALQQQAAWASAKNGVTAYIQNGKVTITASGVSVPVTGTTVGDIDTDARSGWVTINGTQSFDVTPLSAPTVSGNAVIGQTLTATAGKWGSGRSATGAWVRCDAAGANCAPIAGATALTYQVGASDLGKSVRYRETGLWTRGIGDSPAQSVPAFSGTITVTTNTTPPTDQKPAPPVSKCPSRPRFNSVIYKDGVTSFYYRPQDGQKILGARRLGAAKLKALLDTPKGRSSLPRLEYTTAKPVDAKRLPWFARKVGPNRVVTAIMSDASSTAYSGVRLAYQPKKGTYAKLILPNGTVQTLASGCAKVTGYKTIYAQNIFVSRTSK